MYPEWTLLLNATLGLIGIMVGVQLLRKKVKVKKGILEAASIFLLGELIQFATMI